VIARFRDRTSLNAFIKSLLTIPYVKRTVTNVVLNVVKEDFRVNVMQSDISVDTTEIYSGY